MATTETLPVVRGMGKGREGKRRRRRAANQERNHGPSQGQRSAAGGVRAQPYLICAYNSHLEIGAGRIVNLIP